MDNDKKKIVLYKIFIMVFLYFDNLKSNDFPTLARSEFVFACMSSNASTEILWQNALVQ